jgi:hypothetical protein
MQIFTFLVLNPDRLFPTNVNDREQGLTRPYKI